MFRVSLQATWPIMRASCRPPATKQFHRRKLVRANAAAPRFIHESTALHRYLLINSE